MLKNKKMQPARVKNYPPSFHEIWKKYKDITNSIIFSVVLDLFPLTSLEMKGFKNILKLVEPFYEFPSEKQMYEILIPQVYDQIKKKVFSTIKNDLLKGVNKIALTIDGWSCRSVADHMTVTVHYWTEDFEPRHFLLQLESLPKTWNTAQDLFHLIQNVLLKYGFSEDESIIHVVTTNGNNIVKAISMNDKWIRVPCFARLLQLTVDDVLKSFISFNNLVAKCRYMVSVLWSKKTIDSEPKKSHLQSSCILDDFIPSWTSVFEMFNNLLKLRTTLHVFVQESTLSEKLSETDWKAISNYVQIFTLLKQASDMMSKEFYPPLSLYLPTVRGILELIESMNINNQLSIQLIRSICSRFGHINTNESMIIAMVVDPRFKTQLLSEDEKYTVFDIVKNKMLSLNTVNIRKVAKNEKLKISTDTHLELYFSNLKKGKNSGVSPEKIVEAELTYYLCENITSMNIKVNQWWKDNSSRFPMICELAKIYLSVPAVQVSTERAFPNKQGFITDKRAEVLTEQVNVLDLIRISFLNHNLSQFEKEINL